MILIGFHGHCCAFAPPARPAIVAAIAVPMKRRREIRAASPSNGTDWSECGGIRVKPFIYLSLLCIPAHFYGEQVACRKGRKQLTISRRSITQTHRGAT